MLSLTLGEIEKYNNEADWAANALLKHFHTRNPFTILQLINTNISTLSLTHNIGGFTDITSSDNGLHVNIYINKEYDSFSQRIIAAHELGHVIFDSDAQLNMFSDEKTYSNISDYRADLFAVKLLGLVKNTNETKNFYTPEEVHKIIMSKLLYSKKGCYVTLKQQ
ncbi:MAG: ImmA/IrrE family metallo-endopeptidase [Lachnospiraceae bacterium]|nr:ImmA/IrrE family metallo-endopeptidase [Lachnospiraceae bacterium]